jgi:hypothetical protein
VFLRPDIRFGAGAYACALTTKAAPSMKTPRAFAKGASASWSAALSDGLTRRRRVGHRARRRTDLK